MNEFHMNAEFQVLPVIAVFLLKMKGTCLKNYSQ